MIIAMLVACDGPTNEVTYYQDAKPIIDDRCAGCHTDGGIAPFPMTTAEEVQAVASVSEWAIESGSMPPWQPVETCNAYQHSRALTSEQRELLLTFFGADAPSGEPVEPEKKPSTARVFDADVSLKLPEPYTPTVSPDDYRCQILDWEIDTTTYVTGVNIEPDNGAIDHHGIAFLIPAAQRALYEHLDASDPGPGYTCFGGPSGSDLTDLSHLSLPELQDLAAHGQVGGTAWLASWVPGQEAAKFPEGTGIRVNPGDMVVLQMHYNTSSGSAGSDQSTLQLTLADHVEREAVSLPFTNPLWLTQFDPMLIPAGEEATHSTTQSVQDMMFARVRNTLGLTNADSLEFHSAGLHMHNLGTRATLEVRHATGDTSCLLQIDAWDFDWQGSYRLKEPVVVGPEDEVFLTCSWDNRAENQPLTDGVRLDPTDVWWGEGTADEMCLGGMYITGR